MTYNDEQSERELPRNIFAEQCVLGAILYGAAFSLVSDKLTADDFQGASLHHPDIWAAMKWLHERDAVMDMTGVFTRLKRMEITEIRGKTTLTYLGVLWDIALQNGSNPEEDAAYVRDESIRRRLRGKIADMALLLEHEESAQTALEKCEALLYSVESGEGVSDLTPLSDVMEAFLSDLGTKQENYGKVTGVPTGLTDLDGLLGGLQRQELIIVGGQPGQGKTSLLLNILYHNIMVERKHVAFFSLEMGQIDLSRRLVSMDTGINSQFLRTRLLDGDQMERVIGSATVRFADSHTFIDESGDLNTSTMRSKLQRHVARYGPLDLIAVDYLQLMQNDEDVAAGRSRPDSEVQQLSKISRNLKKLAKRFDAPLLAIVSLNRNQEGRANKRPQLSDIRGTGSIAFDGDVIMFISQSQERDGYSIVNIEKHRNGPTGDVTLKFDPTLTRFSDLSESEQAS